MGTELFLGVDQGSSATKAVLVDGDGKHRFETTVPAPPRHVDGRKVEQDGEGILNSVVEAFLECKQWAHSAGDTIRGMGLSCQRSGVLAWGATDGIPRHPLITWADTRTQPIIQNFGLALERIAVKTGIPTIPNFAGGKIALLQRDFLDESILVGTLDSFLLYRMSGRKVFATEDTMAARTMLYSLQSRNWDADLCQDFKVIRKRLPRIHPSLAPHATFEGVAVGALIGDQQAALLGRLDSGNRPLLNLGTIASILVATGAKAQVSPGLITSVLLSRLTPGGYEREFQFLSEINSAVTGDALMEPSRRGWCESLEELDRLCSESLSKNPAGIAIAYFAKNRQMPPRKPNGTPSVMVCRAEATDADRARAIVENVGNHIIRLFEELKNKGILKEGSNTEIDVAGGGAALSFLLQYLADCTGMTFNQTEEPNASARGAALCARMSVEQTFDVRVLNSQERSVQFVPSNPDRKRRYLMWQKLENDMLSDALPSHAEIELQREGN